MLAILYGGYMALAQSDIKRLIAYASIVADHPAMRPVIQLTDGEEQRPSGEPVGEHLHYGALDACIN